MGALVTGWRFWEPTRRQLRDELTEARAEIERYRHDMNTLTAEHVRVAALLRQAQAGQAGADRALARFLDAARPTPCTKIRLIDQAEALQFSATLADDTGRDPSEFHAYRCPHCPRRPVTGTRFWHVANVDPRHRTQRTDGTHVREAKAARRRELGRQGRLLEQHVTPADIAALRRRTKDAS